MYEHYNHKCSIVNDLDDAKNSLLYYEMKEKIQQSLKAKCIEEMKK